MPSAGPEPWSRHLDLYAQSANRRSLPRIAFRANFAQNILIIRINHQITSPHVRVIGDNSKQLGIMSLADALALAKSKGLDLIEIASAANPPVCRLVDYAKFRYEQQKEADKKKKPNPAEPPKPPPNDDEQGFSE